MMGREQPYVVLIDDDEFVGDALRTVLESWGYRVALSMCGDPSCQGFREILATAEAPDLMIVDYRLPRNVTGLDAIATLRGLYGDHIPAILLSGEDQSPVSETAGARGLHWLQKPIDPGRLRSAVRHALEG